MLGGRRCCAKNPLADDFLAINSREELPGRFQPVAEEQIIGGARELAQKLDGKWGARQTWIHRNASSGNLAALEALQPSSQEAFYCWSPQPSPRAQPTG